ncbi:MAG: hypothetical protein ACLPWS_19445 [Rhodomicrobium sp.]
MRAAEPPQHRTLACFVLLLELSSGATSARAGGGFSDPSLVQQSKSGVVIEYSANGRPAVATEEITADVSGDGFNIISTVGGAAAAKGSCAGVWSTVTLLGTVDVQASVPANLTAITSAETTTFSKGGNSISYGIATTEATVVINGQTYAVAKELAIAVARATQFGSSAAVEVDGTLSLPGSGSPSPVSTSKGSSR